MNLARTQAYVKKFLAISYKQFFTIPGASDHAASLFFEYKVREEVTQIYLITKAYEELSC